jgi:hypothetical protein
MYKLSELNLAARLVETLRVPLVHCFASTCGAAFSSRESFSATLSIESCAASLTGSLSRSCGRNTNSGHSGGLSSRRRSSLFLSRSGLCRAAAAGGSASPDSWSGHGEGFATVVDAEVGVRIGGFVCSREL